MSDIYDFNGDCAETFKQTCKCGFEHQISTQCDDEPEYYTDIFVMCKCGESTKFELPVN